MSGDQSNETQFALIHQQLKVIEQTLETILAKLERDYVTQDQFRPVKTIVYGGTALALTALAGGIIKLVLR